MRPLPFEGKSRRLSHVTYEIPEVARSPTACCRDRGQLTLAISLVDSALGERGSTPLVQACSRVSWTGFLPWIAGASAPS